MKVSPEAGGEGERGRGEQEVGAGGGERRRWLLGDPRAMGARARSSGASCPRRRREKDSGPYTGSFSHRGVLPQQDCGSCGSN